MPIRAVCPGCGVAVLAPEAKAGKGLRCRHCAAQIAVPGAGDSPSPSVRPDVDLALGDEDPVGDARRLGKALIIAALAVSAVVASAVCVGGWLYWYPR